MINLDKSRCCHLLACIALIVLATNVHRTQSFQQQSNNSPTTAKADDANHASIHRDAGKIASTTTSASSGTSLQPATRPARHLHQQPKRLIDLSHALNNQTLHWPQNKGFAYSSDIDEERTAPSGEKYHIKSDSINMAIHSGTHLDAPIHFSNEGWTVDQIPLERLIDVPVTVVDVSSKVSMSKNYSVTKDDLIDSKTRESLVAPKSVVLIYTGISQLYDKGSKEYFGTDSKNISEMKIPGISKEAAQYLVERQVYGVGLDSASADSSDRHTNEKYDPQAHTVLNKNNVYILENIHSNLKELLHQTSARLTIAPLSIQKGSGSPVRLVATLGHEECNCPMSNSANFMLMAPASITLVIAAISYLVATRSLASTASY